MKAGRTHILGACRECGARIRLPAGGLSAERIRERLAGIRRYECPGGHVIAGVLLEGVAWDWKPFRTEERSREERRVCACAAERGRDLQRFMEHEEVFRVFALRRAEVGAGNGGGHGLNGAVGKSNGI